MAAATIGNGSMGSFRKSGATNAATSALAIFFGMIRAMGAASSRDASSIASLKPFDSFAPASVLAFTDCAGAAAMGAADTGGVTPFESHLAGQPFGLTIQ